MLVSYDSETALIAPALLAPPLTCGAFADLLEADLLSYKDTCERMRELLANPEVQITGANTVYDLAVLAAEDWTLLAPIFAALDVDRIHCVQNRQRLIDIAKGCHGGYWVHDPVKNKPKKVRLRYSLADLVLRYTGKNRFTQKTDPNGWRLRYSELRDVPVDEYPRDAWEYAVEDAVDTLTVHEAQETLVRELVRDAAHQQRAHFALHLMSCHGVKTDPDAIRKLEVVADKKYEELTESLVKAGLVRPKRTTKTGKEYDETKDTKAARRRIVAAMAALGEPVKLTKGGLKLNRELTSAELEKYAATDEEACRESLDDDLINYAERTSLQIIVASHIPALWKGVDTPIQAHFNILVDSGRISCRFSEDGRDDKKSALNGYQLTNVRRLEGLRECFIPREGKVFIGVDFPMGELHSVSQVCKTLLGYSKLGDTLNAGKDVHLLLAAANLGITYEECVARRHEPEVVAARQFAKIPNFGLWGGMGPKGLRIAFSNADPPVKLSLERCKGVRDTWLNTYDEAREYFALMSNHCGEGHALMEQLFSRRLRGDCRYTSACNTLFQGLMADAAKAALYAVSKECYIGESALCGARPWNFPHDEVLAECDEEIAHEAVHEMARIMREEANKWVPDVPFPELEPVISRCWSKGAGQVWLNGRLIPWTQTIGAYRKAKYKKNAQELEMAWLRLTETEQKAMEAEAA